MLSKDSRIGTLSLSSTFHLLTWLKCYFNYLWGSFWVLTSLVDISPSRFSPQNVLKHWPQVPSTNWTNCYVLWWNVVPEQFPPTAKIKIWGYFELFPKTNKAEVIQQFKPFSGLGSFFVWIRILAEEIRFTICTSEIEFKIWRHFDLPSTSKLFSYHA